MEVNSIKDILNILDYGIVDNNAKFHGVSTMEKIRNYLLAEREEEVVGMWPILSQINQIVANHFFCSNLQSKNDYIRLREIILE